MSTGEKYLGPEYDGTYIRSINPISVVGGSQYRATVSLWVGFYDAGDNYLGGMSVSAQTTFVAPTNASKMNLYVQQNPYQNNVAVFAGTVFTEYVPHIVPDDSVIHTKQYVSTIEEFAEALVLARAASERNVFDIYIAEGTYDVYSVLTDKSGYTSPNEVYNRGLELPDYCNLYGEGAGATLSLVIPEEDNSPEHPYSYIISTLAMHNGEHYIENMNFICDNGKYCIHDDSGFYGGGLLNRTVVFQNCSFEHKGMKSSTYWKWPIVYGAGFVGGRKAYFENCKVAGDTTYKLYVHMQDEPWMTTPVLLQVDNCTFLDSIGYAVFMQTPAISSPSVTGTVILNNNWFAENSKVLLEGLYPMKICGSGNNEVEVENTSSSENFLAEGHLFETYAYNGDATCTADGTETAECVHCGMTNTRTREGSALGHAYVDTVTQPTCTRQGYTTHTCSRCGDAYIDTYVDALGHDWSEWQVTKVATPLREGVETRTCSRCGDDETRVIPKVEPAKKTFPDVLEGEWYYDSVMSAASLGLIEGYDDGSFGPNNTLTRAQAATILWRYYEPDAAASYDASAARNTTGMGDVQSCEWYTGAANWAVAQGVISGKDQADGSKLFDPDGTITREQLCAIVANASAKYADAQVEGSDRARLNGMPDAGSVDPWATDSVAWGLNHGVISGKEVVGGRLVDPLGQVTRAEMAAILMNSINGGLLG